MSSSGFKPSESGLPLQTTKPIALVAAMRKLLTMLNAMAKHGSR